MQTTKENVLQMKTCRAQAKELRLSRRALLTSVLAVIVCKAAYSDEAAPFIGDPTQAPQSSPVGSSYAANADTTLLDSFASRREFVLRAAMSDAAVRRPSFFAASALFAQGRIDEGRAIAHTAAIGIARERVRQVALFRYWPAVDTLIRWPDALTDETKAAIKSVLTSITCYDHTVTSNLVNLAMVTRYLGSQLWPISDYGPGTEFRPDDPTAENNVRKHLKQVGEYGVGEYASRPYSIYNLLPLLSLAELATDPTIKLQAQIAFEANIARFAPTWLDGIWGMASARSYPDIMTQEPFMSAAFLWLYYSGMTPSDLDEPLGAAVMRYQPSALVVEAAADRSKPYVARSRYEGLCQYSFVNRSYVHFSETFPRVKGEWQSYPYGVMFVVGDTAHNDFLWLTAPYNDDPDKGSKKVVSVSHPHGVDGRCVNVAQHEDISLFVFNIGADAPYPYALCFVPGGWKSFLDESDKGCIFLDYGSVLIGITSSLPFAWDRTAGIRAPSTRPRPGASEFRVTGSTFAVAIETAHPDEFQSAGRDNALAAFYDKLTKKIACDNLATPSATYVSRNQIALSKKFYGDGAVNGQRIDLETWPLADSPWTRQPYRGNLTVTDGKTSCVYDFQQMTIQHNA